MILSYIQMIENDFFHTPFEKINLIIHGDEPIQNLGEILKLPRGQLMERRCALLNQGKLFEAGKGSDMGIDFFG